MFVNNFGDVPVINGVDRNTNTSEKFSTVVL